MNSVSCCSARRPRGDPLPDIHWHGGRWDVTGHVGFKIGIKTIKGTYKLCATVSCSKKNSMARSYETALHLSVLLFAGYTSAFMIHTSPFVLSRSISSLRTVGACRHGSSLRNCRYASYPAPLARKSSVAMSSALPSSDKLELSGSTPMSGCVVNLIKNIVSSLYAFLRPTSAFKSLNVNLIRLGLAFCASRVVLQLFLINRRCWLLLWVLLWVSLSLRPIVLPSSLVHAK